jgi:TM2 domain-containing membrane protein YozV
MYCSRCGNTVDGKQFCDKCGNSVGGPAAAYPQNQMVYMREKSEGVAAVLSFLWAGLGQIYVGKIARGLGIMVGGLLIGLLFIPLVFLLSTIDMSMLVFIILLSVVSLIYVIWNVFDAYKLAKEYNDKFRSTGQRPW